MKTSNVEPHGLHAAAATRGQRSALLAGAKGMTWRDSSTESIGQIRDMTVVGLTFIDNEDGTGILTTGSGTGGSGGGGGLGTPPWFNVVDYGAVGDGVTLDCDAINAAIDDINAGGRGVLYFPPGTYLCDSGLNAITVPCHVIGEGRGSPGVAPATSSVVCSSSTAVLFDIQDHVAFTGLDIRNSATTPSAGAGIAATAGGLIGIRDCLIKGFYINVDVQEGGGWHFDNTWFVGPIKYALKVRNISSPDGGDQSITSCWFYASDGRTADAAIRMESAGGMKITNCKFNFLNASGAFVRMIDVAPAASTSILLVHGNSFENMTGDSIHIETSGFQWDHISIVGNQFGHYSNTTGNAIEITCANIGEVEGVVISSNIFRQTGGGTPVCVALTKANDVTLVGNVYEQGWAGGNISNSGSTNIVNLDLLGATPSGELGGTWDAITVDSVHSGSAHLAIGSTSTTAAAGNHTHSGIAPPAILLASDHATPFTFDDILQASDGSDFLYASE